VDKAVLLGGYSSSGAAMAVLQTVETGKTPMIAATL
jgi:hypothetical protein